ncbi:hypothetical protein F5879DRAFT_927392 [Lentinula edodes]|nr:hypothetical protein F5879DRAFT_927392 [Lentinula edodes]
MLILPILHYHHLAPFFLLLTFVARDCVLALPVGNYSTSLYLREAIGPAPDELIVGYRYVSKEKADEYNKAGTLTAIPATTKSIGEGAYLSPRLGEFPGKLDEWVKFSCFASVFKFGVVTSMVLSEPIGSIRQCIIIGKKSKILDVQTPEVHVPSFQHFHPPPDSISAQPVKLLLYAHKKGFEIGKTLLFSRHFVFKGTLQMLIPPMFLVKSPSNPSRPAGANSLGLRIHCTPLGGLGKNRPAADWHSWKIHNWPASIMR